jgi:hypothetical protein
MSRADAGGKPDPGKPGGGNELAPVEEHLFGRHPMFRNLPAMDGLDEHDVAPVVA